MSKKGNKRTEEPDDGLAAPSGSEMAQKGSSGRVEELTALVKSLIERKNAKDKKLDEEMSLQEQRWKAMQHQFQQIQQQVQRSEHSESNVQWQPVVSDTHLNVVKMSKIC